MAVDFAALTAYDLDYVNTSATGVEPLDEICAENDAANDPAACTPVMLRTME